ncbi:hypothetical protein D7Z54_25725 [Salibacterium salarium]|uniref:Uncharacterized protein n=1 Tax=Salibacterium salarium TaxID=284579 RepID=A0A3R9QHD3_9BACI|nr:hypothetical protein D7Z54_25725 [Salibacterium salarium]
MFIKNVIQEDHPFVCSFDGLFLLMTVKFSKEHLQSCEDCTNYFRYVERNLPSNDSIDGDAEKNDQKLMKGIKRRIYTMMFIAILIGVLVGSFSWFLHFL